ncbi:histidinol dehydrogenase [Natronomonas sp. CBA1123]|uniref:histidinol dehydrogenase n=1 Tax=Natronomonas sp. CBA1123 TaxID=2668070 RepID=UPI0012E9B469|nr:histidinol dehydrogenase [Natronomonas sp. CBA1123]MUV85373.1 histidinol dehydrogenase [Natronomonas sp. CBA1123]
MDVQKLSALSPAELDAIHNRDTGLDAIRNDVRDIINQVRTDGDEALYEFNRRFDDVDSDTLVATDAISGAADVIDEDVRYALEVAIDRVRAFHERQRRDDWTDDFEGLTLGRQFRPIERVGAYVPGGSAAYPSTVIMTVVPAKVAGVEEVAVVTPPADEINPVTLAALDLAGADEVYTVGGAQAIAALAYGTDSIPPVEKIVGPGNRWVAAAKADVRGDVAIDMIAGPTEVLILADETATPKYVAAELVAQAEHDPHSSAVAVTPDETVAEAVVDEVDRQISDLDRSDTIREALANDSSGVFLADSMTDATTFAESYAVEHLVVQTANQKEVVDAIDSAGSVFMGEYSPVAVGDYASGTNHVLPTSGAARTTGGLSIDTFVRSRTVQELDREGLESISEAVVTLAELEGLDAHAESVRTRLE